MEKIINLSGQHFAAPPGYGNANDQLKRKLLVAPAHKSNFLSPSRFLYFIQFTDSRKIPE